MLPQDKSLKNHIQVYHHLGLGDHIICNGLIRELCKYYAKVHCFVKEVNMSSVSFMYRDEPKINLIAVTDDREVYTKVQSDTNLIKIGFDNLEISQNNFDLSFYQQLGYDFSLRWNNFYVQRDYQVEAELFQKLNPSNLPYIFVHDDPSRGLQIDRNNIRRDIKIIKVSDVSTLGKIKVEFQKYNLFHWILVLERSLEIHCMDSAFKCLVESLPSLGNTKLFFHRYVKGKGPLAESTMKKAWTIVKYPSLSFRVNALFHKFYNGGQKLAKRYSSWLREQEELW